MLEILGFLGFIAIVGLGVMELLRKPKIVAERRSSTIDDQLQHVELRIIYPGRWRTIARRNARRTSWSLDGQPVEAREVAEATAVIQTTTGQHKLAAKRGGQNITFELDTPRNGLYELHLKQQGLVGPYRKVMRVVTP